MLIHPLTFDDLKQVDFDLFILLASSSLDLPGHKNLILAYLLLQVLQIAITIIKEVVGIQNFIVNCIHAYILANDAILVANDNPHLPL